MDTDIKKTPAAVYVAFGTFKNAIDSLAVAIPNRIDKTVYPGLNPAVVNHLLAAFKFLGLIEDSGKPTALLQAVAAKDEPVRKHQLATLIKQRYAELFALDLVKTTPLELAERMEKSYAVTGETRDKAIRFFLAAAAYLGIPVSPLLSRPTNANGQPQRKRRQNKAKDVPIHVPPALNHQDGAPQSGSSRVINLSSGGTLTISASMNFLSLSPSDRKFFSDLIDRFDEYESKLTKEAIAG